MNQIVAERILIFRSSEGNEFLSSISIGMPKRMADLEWNCDVEIQEVDKPRLAYGIDSLQALINAMSLAQATLFSRVKRGWQISWPDNKRPTTPEEIFGYDFNPLK